MLSDLDCVTACWNTYWRQEAFDKWFDGSTTDGVVCGVKASQDCTVIAFRGSTTAQDWARDFFAVPHSPVEHPQLGTLHAGFALGMDKTYEALAPFLHDNVVVTGHSLAAARAMIFAGLMQVSGITPKAVVVFGEPKPGYQKLSDVLAPVMTRSYKNCDDVVTHVPFTLLDLRYCHPKPLLQVDVPPSADDPWGVLGAHHCENYLQAMRLAGT